MNPRRTRFLVAGPAAALLIPVWLTACGTGERTPGADDAPSGDERPAAQAAAERMAAAFVPRADQFGVRAFTIEYRLEGQTTGTRTLYVEDHGARVGVEESSTAYGETRVSQYYWDGERGHLKGAPQAGVFASRLRLKTSEPTSFATTPAASLETVGYNRIGDRTVAGLQCEHWRNETLGLEGCRWRNIELEFHNGAGTDRIVQSTVATKFTEGTAIPARLKALAD